MKKFLAISLALLLLLAALAACTDGTTNETNEPTGTTGADDGVTDVVTVETNENGEEKIEVDLEDLDFQGMSIGIAARHEDRYRREFSMDTITDPVDQKVFTRNSQIEKELGLKMVFIPSPDFWTTDGIISVVTTEYQSGVTSQMDIVAPYAAYAVTPSLRGYYVNLAGDDMTYLDITKGHWNQTYVKNALCYDQLYYIVGDLNLTVYDKAIACFANMDLAQANDINPDEIYQTVLDGDWNYDYFYNILNNFTYLDENDNNTVDVNDIVPITTIWSSEGCDGFSHAWEIQFMQEEDDGSHTLTIDGNTKLAQGVAKMQEMYGVQGALLLSGVGPSFEQCFLPGRALFDIDIIYRNADVNNKLRNVDFEYAILPLPMYDDAQTEYHTTAQDAYNTMSVIAHHPEKFEAISATLELLANKSYNTVRPFYIEKMVKATYISGANQVKMIELVMNGVTFDTATIYNGQVNSVALSLWRACIANGQTVDDRWAAKRAETETAVETFDIWFQTTAE